jgi:hypothetical protein
MAQALKFNIVKENWICVDDWDVFLNKFKIDYDDREMVRDGVFNYVNEKVWGEVSAMVFWCVFDQQYMPNFSDKQYEEVIGKVV